MGTSSAFGFTFEVFDIVYFNFIRQLFSPLVVVVFSFCLSPFELRLSQYLGLRLSLVGHVCFQHYIFFCCHTSEVG